MATSAGALPEVVGEVGVRVPRSDPELVADAVRRALELGPEEGARARRRILERFPLEPRARGPWAEVEAAARGERSG